MKKPAIILIHGLRGDHHGLLELAECLQEAGYETYVPDLPGYGIEQALRDQSLKGYANWLHEYVEKQKFETKPIILGHSMGSIIVSHYLEAYPEDCSKTAVFLAPIIRTEKGQKRSNRLAKMFLRSLKLLSGHSRYRLMKSRFVSFWISRILTYDRTRQKFIDEQHYMYSGEFTSTRSLMNDVRLSMSEQTICPKNRKVLYCMGDHDRLTKVKNVKKNIANRPNATLKVIKKTGHLLNYEFPQKTAQVITQFLDKKS